MNAVLLEQTVFEDAFEQERDQRHMVFRGEGLVHGLKLADVVAAVIGRQRDAGQQNADVRGRKAGHDLIQVCAGGADRYSAKTVVATELKDHDARLLCDDAADAGKPIRRGFATDAEIHNMVRVARFVQVALEVVGITLAGVGAVASSEAVAESHDYWTLRGARAGSNQNATNIDREESHYQP
jgi:hypothetical protein